MRNIREEPRLTYHQDGSLEISDIREEDDSQYSCRAYNSVGSDTRTYTVIVHSEYDNQRHTYIYVHVYTASTHVELITVWVQLHMYIVIVLSECNYQKHRYIYVHGYTQPVVASVERK